MAEGGAGQSCDQPLQDAWQILELAAIHYPDKLAVVDCSSQERLLTYAQLHERASALAAFLRRRGVRRGDRVGILCRNSSHVMELHFAAAALHAVVVNLNIHLAPPELAYILSDSGPKIVFADRHLAPPLLAARAQLAAGSVPAVAAGLVWIDVDAPTAAAPAQEAAAGGLEYEACVSPRASRAELSMLCMEVLAEGSVDDGYHMYYTSGTTGHPKGVVLSHCIVVHHAVGTIQGTPLSSPPAALFGTAHPETQHANPAALETCLC